VTIATLPERSKSGVGGTAAVGSLMLSPLRFALTEQTTDGRRLYMARSARGVGHILLAIWLILTGLFGMIGLTFNYMGIVMGILALIAGLLILIGR
jgi:hypothetical protein